MIRRSVYWLIAIALLSCWASRSWAAGRNRFVVVLDAGHGGKDPGTVGHGGKEKDITLSVVRKIGRMLQSDYPNIQVLYTRQRDVFVGLQERADFANRHKASLFISVHVNSAGKNSAITGTETYVLGLGKQGNNLSVAMRENEVMLLEDNYKQTYKGFNPRSSESYIMFDLMQEAYFNQSISFASELQRQYKRTGFASRGVRQDILWVLSQSAMPSVLTEIGFLSNAHDATLMLSDSGQEQIARAIVRGFARYWEAQGKGNTARPAPIEQEDSLPDTAEPKTAQEGMSSIGLEETRQAERSNRGSSASERRHSSTPSKVSYKIQIMSTPEDLSPKSYEIKRVGRPVTKEKIGKTYAYLVGDLKTLEEAKKLRTEIRKRYKDAVIVRYERGKRQQTIY